VTAERTFDIAAWLTPIAMIAQSVIWAWHTTRQVEDEEC
jgi:hypothetical protein